MHAARPPSFSIRRIRATKSSSVFFVFTLPVSDGCTSDSSRLPLNGGLARITSKPSIAWLGKRLGERVAQRVLIVDVGRLDAVQHQVHGRDAEHRRVEVVAVEHAPSGCACGTAPAGRRV